MGKFLNLIHALGGLTLPVVSSAATPASGEVSVYAKSDGNIYKKTSDGTETAVTGGSGGGSTPLASWPVGSIFMSTVATNPATLLGGGTWSAWGTGRVPVGIDTSDTDFNTAEKVGGEKTHQLVSGELPNHSHKMDHDHPAVTVTAQYSSNTVTGSSGSGVRVGNVGGSTPGGGTDTSFQVDVPNYAGDTGSTGSNTPHNNVQPYITCYMWKRTA